MTGYLRAADASDSNLAAPPTPYSASRESSPGHSSDGHLERPPTGVYGQGNWSARDLSPAARLEQARAEAAAKLEPNDYREQTELHADFTPPPPPRNHKAKVTMCFIGSGLVVVAIITVTILGIKGIA